jgi:uncharacterized protein (UPF0276 family)
MLQEVPFLGVGLGFRREIGKEILSATEQIDFLELIADQYIDRPEIREEEAVDLAARFPVILHGVDFSVGTDCPLDETYLRGFCRIADLTQPHWVSDHLCLTRIPGNSLGQLTPLSFTDETVKIAAKHISEIANAVRRPFLIENISYYFKMPGTVLTEAEFITAVVRESNCWLLLDLANVMNNAANQGYDAREFLDELPLDRVVQIHLAGSSYSGPLLIDSHSHPVPDQVFDLLRYVAPRMPSLRGVLIERDQNFPPFEELVAELEVTRQILKTHWAPHHHVDAVFPSVARKKFIPQAQNAAASGYV